VARFEKLSPLIIYWLVFIFIISLVAGLVNLTVQQNYRQSANDPQIQMSEDLAHKISLNPIDTTLTLPENLVDVSQSLAPFIIVYDDQGKVLSSAVVLDGQTPNLPIGVLAFTKTHMQNRLTWQPKVGVRIAAVITRFEGKSSGYVLAGRSLREVEDREEMLEKHVISWWIISTILSLLLSAFLHFSRRTKFS
jgi:hypothetical protein